MKKVLLSLIRVYQRYVSPAFPARCRYTPTCSAYAFEAISKYGAEQVGRNRHRAGNPGDMYRW